MPTLVPGYVARRPAIDDAQAIFDVVAGYNTEAIGEPDYTVEDIADELVEPGFDRERDGWVVEGPGGALVGWAWAMRQDDTDHVDVSVYTHGADPAVAAWLWDTVEQRAVELAAKAGHDRVEMDTVVYRQEEDRAAQMAGRGYAVTAIFNRLRIDHTGSVPVPTPPAGVTLRNGTEGEEVLRAAHAVHTASFEGHYGFNAQSYEAWYERFEASSANDWALLDLAYVDGVPAAMVRRTNAFVETDRCGYVHQLAVHPAFQGRGLGRFLLRHSFAADAALGHVGTLLHVDTDPSRPALNLYLSVGMRPVRIMDVHRRTVTAALSAT